MTSGSNVGVGFLSLDKTKLADCAKHVFPTTLNGLDKREMLAIKVTASVYKVSESTVYRWIKKINLPSLDDPEHGSSFFWDVFEAAVRDGDQLPTKENNLQFDDVALRICQKHLSEGLSEDDLTVLAFIKERFREKKDECL